MARENAEEAARAVRRQGFRRSRAEKAKVEAVSETIWDAYKKPWLVVCLHLVGLVVVHFVIEMLATAGLPRLFQR